MRFLSENADFWGPMGNIPDANMRPNGANMCHYDANIVQYGAIFAHPDAKFVQYDAKFVPNRQKAGGSRQVGDVDLAPDG